MAVGSLNFSFFEKRNLYFHCAKVLYLISFFMRTVIIFAVVKFRNRRLGLQKTGALRDRATQ